MKYVWFLFCLSFAHANDQAYFSSGKAFAETVKSTAELSNGIDVPHFQGTDVKEAKLNSSELSEAAVRKTNDANDDVGSALIDTQSNSLEYDYRITNDDDLIRDSNAVVADPMTIIGGTVSKKSKEFEEVETTHTCEESAEPITHVCVRERILNPITQEDGIVDIEFWYQAFAPNVYLELDLLRDRFIQGTYWTPHGNKRARDCSAGVSTVFPKHLIPYVIATQLVTAPQASEMAESISLSETGKFIIKYKNWTSGDKYYRSKKFGRASVSYNRPILKDSPENDELINQCQSLETLTDRGLCRYGEVRIIEGPGERTIEHEGKTIRVYRDWWKKEFTYVCKAPSKNNCEPFRKQGCERIGSVCIEREGDVCVNHRKTFLCRTRSRGFEVTGFTGDIPFCLDGNCDDHSWTDNKDFADAMSKLSIFKEMQNDMDSEAATVFKGSEHQCNKDVMGFQDCCQGKGWGDGIGLARSCSPSENELRDLKAQNKCAYVGTYCAEKVLGICVRKKKSYCCFGSKLSKIVQEQGRAQLGLDWGSADAPNCRSLTIDEVKSIDFSSMNLSELFSDILGQSNLNNIAGSVDQLTSKWTNKVQNATPIKRSKNMQKTYEYFGLEGQDASL